jgi:hypothetical protein
MIAIGVPDRAALERVLTKLRNSQLPHYVWVEPDNDFGMTAIATAPLNEQQKTVLQNYRLWKFGGVDEKSSCSFTGDPATSSLVAQAKSTSLLG